MKIMVAGGAGFIGSILIPKLLERGYEVDVLDLFWFGNHLPKEVKFIHKNIFDLDENDIKGYDQVIFLAGLSNDPMAEYSPAENFISNGSAPSFLAYIAKKAGVKRFIYAGSCSVYGYTVNELYDENSPAISNYPYGISKLQGENAVLQMQDKSFSVIAFRQGTISGYSPRMRLDLVVNTMFKFALTEGVITINNPAIWRPILSIQDAATAYIRALESNEDINGVFNVASGNYTVGEIGDLVKSGVKKYLNLDVRLNIKHIQDYRNYKVSIDKARNVLSFHPKHNVETIIEDLVENRDKFKDFANPNYYNIQVFKQIAKK
ncbi:MAG: NAD(P)-dependent oxidoreductase [Acidobacteria bacterium]|jgi:nucleoside-diphosphate-sugar epimerase|nr:NAD(P)-dependent oxidoreductase [Acidobacteriota bacterium]